MTTFLLHTILTDGHGSHTVLFLYKLTFPRCTAQRHIEHLLSHYSFFNTYNFFKDTNHRGELPNNPMAHNEEQSFLELAPEGDVILVVSKDAGQRKLRVHSSILKSASPVFAAMFGPHFAEGQFLDSSNPKTVDLPDDEPEAMTLICSVIHHRNELCVVHPCPENYRKIYDTAIAADKYDCTKALRFASMDWMRRVRDTTKPENLIFLLESAYFFDDHESFALITENLILYWGKSYVDLWTEIVNNHDNTIPWKFLCMFVSNPSYATRLT